MNVVRRWSLGGSGRSHRRLGEKAMVCLRIAELPIGSAAREEAMARASVQFSAKAVYTKMNELVDRGYLEYGVSVRGCWLTDKGREALSC